MASLDELSVEIPPLLTLLSERDQAHVLARMTLLAADAIMITDADLDHPDGPVIEQINPPALVPRGLSTDDMVGKRLARLLRPDILAPALANLRETRDLGAPIAREVTTQRKSGKAVRLELTVMPIADDSGVVRHFLSITRDVTLRHQAEQERAATLWLLASVFGAIDAPLGVIDDSWRFGFANAALGRQLGWSTTELLGQPFVKVLSPVERDTVQRRLNAVVTPDAKIQVATTLIRPDGTLVPGDIIATLIIQPGNRHYRLVTIVPKPADLDSQFEAAVRNALSRGDAATVVAGKLQLVGLDEVRASLGDRWAAVAERTYGIADQILRRHLGPADVVTRMDDGAYIVFFAELTEAEAHFKAQAIALEIRERLIGEVPEVARPRVAACAVAVPAETIRKAPSRLADIIDDTLNQRLVREQQRVAQAAMAVVKSGLTAAAIRFTAVRTGTNQPAPILVAHPPRELSVALMTLHELGYSDYAVEAEMALLTGCGERVLADLGQDKTDLILAGVRMETLVGRRTADRWLPLARGLGPPAKRRLAIEVRELDRDSARSRISDLVNLLSSLFRLTAFELPALDLTFINGLPLSVTLVTIPCARLGAEDDETAVIANTGKLIKVLTNRKCRLIVKQVRSPAVMATLARAGVSLLLPSFE